MPTKTERKTYRFWGSNGFAGLRSLIDQIESSLPSNASNIQCYFEIEDDYDCTFPVISVHFSRPMTEAELKLDARLDAARELDERQKLAELIKKYGVPNDA